MNHTRWAAPFIGFTLVVALVTPVGAIEDAEPLRIVVQTDSAAPITSARVTLEGVALTASADGAFLATGAGAVRVEAPAYLPAEYAWDGTPGRLTVKLAPRPVFALHVTGDAAANRWSSMLAIAARSAVNALVIDLKDESGRVFSSTPSGVAATVGASTPRFDLSSRAEAAHNAGLYVIVRVVAFQDPIAARAEPSWAVWNTATAAPYNKAGQWFLDPWDPDAREYALTLAEDACAMGVDEVQFDYVRFPDGYPTTARFDGPTTETGRKEAITGFLAEAAARLHPTGCAVAADIFGFITSTPGDGGIGQQLEELAQVADVLSPMLYPSHYSTGWFGFSDPNAHPYDVVARALADGQARIDDTPAVLRPWIQDFYYSTSQVNAEIRAADDRGVGWILWNALSSFTEAAIPAPGILDVEDARSTTRFEVLPGSGFWDVPDGYLFENEVTWLAQEGITLGCNPPANDLFCPSLSLTRGQMAAVLSRALDYPAGGTADHFIDDDLSIFENDIDRLAAARVTLGCNPPANDRFCPNNTVSRAQMAALLHRALPGLPETRAPINFADDDDSVFEADIEWLYSRGITQGASATTFGPRNPVTRAQMAAFLYRALAGSIEG